MSLDITRDAKTDSPYSVAAVLREHGCVCFRNALPRKPVLLAGEAVHANARRLNELVGHEVNDMPLCFGDQRCRDPSVLGFRGNSLEDFSDPLAFSGFTPDWFFKGERNYKRWFWDNGATFPNLVLGLVIRSQLPAIYHILYGERVICSYAHCAARYQRSDLKHKGYAFHQDASYYTRDPLDHVGLTTWIPLVDCGVDAPGLQLYPRALEKVLPAPEGADLPSLFCDTQTVINMYGGLWVPVLSAGDVLIFNHFVVHRTYITHSMTNERQSVDFRVFPQSRIPNFILKSGGWSFELSKTGIAND